MIAGALGPARVQAANELPPMVYVTRAFAHAPDLQLRQEAIERATAGELRLFDGSMERVLVDAADAGAAADTPTDVSDPSVSRDGERIVFSGYSPQDGAWRIYEIDRDGTDLRKVTRSDLSLDLSRHGAAASRLEGYDDVDPCYLPNGDICFVSTRYPGLAPAGRLRATNLFRVRPDGSDLRRITTERFGADTPTVDPSTGRIIYSRWWITDLDQPPPPTSGAGATSPYYQPSATLSSSPIAATVISGTLDQNYPGVNNWILASINPDGSGLGRYTGYRLNREVTMAYRPAVLQSGKVAYLFIRESPVLGYPGQHGLRLSEEGARIPLALGGPQRFVGDGNFPDPLATQTPRFKSPRYFYQSVEELPDGRLLVTATTNGSRDSVADYDIYVKTVDDAAPTPIAVLGVDLGQPGRSELDAVPLVRRQEAPVVEDAATELANEEIPRTPEEASQQNGTFLFREENIFMNGDVDSPVAMAPAAGERLTIEFYMNPQRTGVTQSDEPILIGSREIGDDGKVEMELPAGVPLFEIVRREDGRIATGRDGQIFHVGGMNFGVAGAEARCVGCHSGHSEIEVPDDSSWFNLAPSALLSSSSILADIGGSPTTRRGFSFTPDSLVDLQTDFITREWAAAENDRAPWIGMRWKRPIRAREVIVYGVDPGLQFFESREDHAMQGFTVTTYLEDRRVDQKVSFETIRGNAGVRVQLDPTREFSSLSITLGPVTGTYEGAPVAALSEIEVIGKLVPDRTVVQSFLRGDANCDSAVDSSDVIATLGGLYLGASFCCEVAADANADEVLDNTDAIQLLHWLYLGGEPPPDPGPELCGLRSRVKLSCDVETCP